MKYKSVKFQSMSTKVRNFYVKGGDGHRRLFIERESPGGKILSVKEVVNPSTSHEIRIPLDNITDDESLKRHVESMTKNGRGVEAN